MANVLNESERGTLVAASILSADFGRLEAECRSVLEAEGGGDAGRADLLHLDVMDGHFVPNLTMGPDLCRGIRRWLPDATLDAHLMVTSPGDYVEAFADAGADHLTFHIEPASEGYRSRSGGGGGPVGKGYDVLELAERVRGAGMSVGLAINPPTPVEAALELVDAFDLVLVMSVHPGFSGQSFIEATLEKTARIRERLREDQRLQMDGGINLETAEGARAAGVDVLVAASAIFGRRPEERGEAIAGLRGAQDRQKAG